MYTVLIIKQIFSNLNPVKCKIKYVGLDLDPCDLGIALLRINHSILDL